MFKRIKDKTQLDEKYSLLKKRVDELETRIEQLEDIEIKELLKKVLKNSIETYRSNHDEFHFLLRLQEIENTICHGKGDK